MKKLIDRINKKNFFDLLTGFYDAYRDTNNPFYDGAIKGSLLLNDFVCVEQIESRLITLEHKFKDSFKENKNLCDSVEYYTTRDLETAKFRPKDLSLENYWDYLGEMCVLNYLYNILK